MMNKKITIFWIMLTLCSCSRPEPDIHEIKLGYGDFKDQTLKWKPVDYTRSPIYKKIEHHPENYSYLDKADIYSIAHISDGLLITGFLAVPKADGRFPCIIYNRGGNRDLGLLLVGTAVEVMAPLAAQGYVVAASNYRGNSRAEGADEFGGADVNDVINLIKSLGEYEKADTSRVGLLGISRGGMMNYLTLKNPGLSSIKAAVTIGGITNLETTIRHHPEIGEVAEELIPAFRESGMEELQKRSVVFRVNELPVSTPLLIMHSKTDEHVNYSQTPIFADSLDKYAIPYQLISFENDTHGLAGHRDLVMTTLLSWFDVYVKNGQPFQETEKRKVVK